MGQKRKCNQVTNPPGCPLSLVDCPSSVSTYPSGSKPRRQTLGWGLMICHMTFRFGFLISLGSVPLPQRKGEHFSLSILRSNQQATYKTLPKYYATQVLTNKCLFVIAEHFERRSETMKVVLISSLKFWLNFFFSPGVVLWGGLQVRAVSGGSSSLCGGHFNKKCKESSE